MRDVIRATVWVLLAILPGIAIAGSVVDTAHNLSVTGPGAITAASEEQICEFCHAPHSSTNTLPLWNRSLSSASYTPYSSSTIVAAPGQPTGDSVLCLSCHDGTIALGNVASQPSPISMSGGVTTMPNGDGLIGTDLSHDHPISFDFTATLASQNGELATPGSLPPSIKLDANGQLQCTSCHDAHSNDFGAFLVMPNVGSLLCTECHLKTGWTQSSHSQSGATWNNIGQDPWPHSTLTTVSENACGSCHQPHLEVGGPRLLNEVAEEGNCLACHNGNVAGGNIDLLVNRISAHRVQDTTLVHDPVEAAIVDTRHVECADCHNSHATDSTRSPGDTPANVRGVNLAGAEVTAATNTYEICLRCHGDSPNQPPARTPRQIDQSNIRLKIQPGNPSFHPIGSPGQSSNVPSLISPLTEQSVIGCGDCHNSNSAGTVTGGSGPEGPHGSIYDPILSRNYETADNTQESAANYALCYSCHSRTSILNDQSFGDHDRHIRGEDTPCNACHDPHGISNIQGNATNNSHLINFDTSIVFPNNNGDLRFVDGGNQTGSCDLDCHGQDHDNENY